MLSLTGFNTSSCNALLMDASKEDRRRWLTADLGIADAIKWAIITATVIGALYGLVMIGKIP